MDTYRQIIHENFDYNILIERYDKASVDEYVRIMLDAICSQKRTIRVDCGEYPVEVVKSRLLKLDSSHLEYVMDCMAKNTTKVRNIKNYILTALYNSYITIDKLLPGGSQSRFIRFAINVFTTKYVFRQKYV